MSKAFDDAMRIGNHKLLEMFNSPAGDTFLDGFDEGAKALLEWARSKKFDVINDESPVVLIADLEAYFAEQSK